MYLRFKYLRKTYGSEAQLQVISASQVMNILNKCKNTLKSM